MQRHLVLPMKGSSKRGKARTVRSIGRTLGLMLRFWGIAVAAVVATVCSPPPTYAEACDVEMLPGTHGLDMPIGQGMIKSMPDGHIWFGEATTIARVNPTTPYAITKFSIPTLAGVTNDVAAGPDGHYWFTEIIGNKIGRISPEPPHEILEIALPPGATQPDSIVGGPDGHLWFTQWSGQIGRISPKEPYKIDQYALPEGGVPREMIAGRDGVLWYTNPATNAIGRITPHAGGRPQIREFQVPTDNARPVGLAEGSDGTIWFTEFMAGAVGWFDPSTPEAMREAALVSASSAPVDIALGRGGELWVTVTGADLVGRLRPRGRGQPPTLTECAVPETPWFLDVGADGAVWFTTFHDPGIQIGRIQPDEGPSAAPSANGSRSEPTPPARRSEPMVESRLPSTGRLPSAVSSSVPLVVGALLVRLPPASFVRRGSRPSRQCWSNNWSNERRRIVPDPAGGRSPYWVGELHRGGPSRPVRTRASAS